MATTTTRRRSRAIPIALGAVTLLALGLAASGAFAGDRRELPPREPPLPPPPPGPRRLPQPAPAGAGLARVNPNSQGGMIVRRGPGTNHPMLAPPGNGVHAFNGEEVYVFRTDIPPEDGQGGTWWEISTAGGGRGFARGVDSAGVRNFTTIRPPQQALAAGSIGGCWPPYPCAYPYGYGYGYGGWWGLPHIQETASLDSFGPWG